MVGILAVQGAFQKHGECLDKLSESYKFIRKPVDITSDIDRLILPGGESTVQRKLISELGMFDKLNQMISRGMPVLATCAGLILLSEEVKGGETTFRSLPVRVCRNAYGRQLGSFSTVGSVGNIPDFPMRFIRAPFIEKVLSDKVEVLNVTDGRITSVRYGNQFGIAFHPELTDDLRVHELFCSAVE